MKEAIFENSQRALPIDGDQNLEGGDLWILDEKKKRTREQRGLSLSGVVVKFSWRVYTCVVRIVVQNS